MLVPVCHLVQMLPTEGVRDLSARIGHVGLYRVVARDPATQKMIKRKDWSLRPTPVPGRPKPVEKPATSDAIIDLYKAQGAGDCGEWVTSICDKPHIGCLDSRECSFLSLMF